MAGSPPTSMARGAAGGTRLPARPRIRGSAASTASSIRSASLARKGGAAEAEGGGGAGGERAPGEPAHPRVGRVHRFVHQVGVAGAEGGLREAEARREPPED